MIKGKMVNTIKGSKMKNTFKSRLKDKVVVVEDTRPKISPIGSLMKKCLVSTGLVKAR